MMAQGRHRILDEQDLWDLPESDTAEKLTSKLSRFWKLQLKATNPNLTIALLRAFGWPFLLATVFKLLQDTLAFAQPQLLRQLLYFVDTYSTEHPDAAYNGSVVAVGMLCV